MLMIPLGTKFPIILIQNMLWEGLTTSRFDLFCVSLAERYIAIRQPLTYHGHLVVYDILKKLLMFSFFSSTGLQGIFIATYAKKMCIDNIIRPTHLNGGNLIAYFMDFSGPVIISLNFIQILAIKKVCELKRSLDSSREQHTEKSQFKLESL